ncbi:hypothetical protein [uncultured Granulicatella sp.]|uniref:hypothetical protein n=1 Tax=uncultured Granulicatella sp. TaxID=316089 RepID=UPI0028D75278|nr:hypothetical protein [uncultured Granulicatella sp.]
MDEKNVTADKERIKENWLKTENIIDVGLKINNMSAIIRKEKEQREKQEKHIRTLSTFIAWTIGYALMAVIHYYVLGDFIREVLNVSPIFVSRLYTIGAFIMLFCTFIVSLKNPS